MKMGIRIRKSNNAKGYRPMWYITYRDDQGKLKSKMTPIPILGKPPASLSVKELGDLAYEKSKTKAEEFLNQFLADKKIKGSAQELTKTLIEEKTGRKLEYAKISDLYSSWLGFSRDREVCEERKTLNKAIFKRFSDFLKADSITKDWQFLYEVTPKKAKEFIDSVKVERAASTVKDYKTLLSGAFHRLLPEGIPNPFSDIKVGTMSTDSAKIHRKPLTEDELTRLYKVAKESADPWLYPITVCAAETGFRIEDVCLLKWTSVFLDQGRISVRTSKTGTEVNLPIFPELQKVLESRLTEKDPSDKYVFPEAANMYLHNKSGIKYRGKRLFAEAIFGDIQPTENPTDVVNGKPKPPMTEEEVVTAIQNSPFIAPKKALAIDIYHRYKSGQSYTTIAKDLGILRSRICTILKNIEELTGEQIRPWAVADAKQLRLRLTQQRHEIGKNSVSIYGWHSLRATFCVRAYMRKVPDYLIQAAAGHSTFKTTMKYYINPTWKVFKDAWEGKKVQPSLAPNLNKMVAALTSDQKHELLIALSLCWESR